MPCREKQSRIEKVTQVKAKFPKFTDENNLNIQVNQNNHEDNSVKCKSYRVKAVGRVKIKVDTSRVHFTVNSVVASNFKNRKK